jgi:hypothetical protein
MRCGTATLAIRQYLDDGIVIDSTPKLYGNRCTKNGPWLSPLHKALVRSYLAHAMVCCTHVE